MALIKCGECYAEISDKAAACVKCGAPIEKRTATKSEEASDPVPIPAQSKGSQVAALGAAERQTLRPQTSGVLPNAQETKKKKRRLSPVWTLVLLVLGVGFLALFGSSFQKGDGKAPVPAWSLVDNTDSQSEAQASANEDADTASAAQPTDNSSSCEASDLSCRLISADVYCKSPIEKLAMHDMKWTIGFAESRFSRYRHTPGQPGALTFVGDKAEFQNGYGAYTPVVYECDLAANDKTVLAVRIVREGRLGD